MPRKKQPRAAPPRKQEADQPWIDERLAYVGLSRLALGARLGQHPNAIGRILRGELKPKVEEVISMARELRVPLGELLVRLGYTYKRRDCPLVGSVTEMGRVNMFGGQLRHVASPDETDEDLQALSVETDYLALALYAGSYLYFAPAEALRSDVWGKLCLVDIQDEPAPVVGIVARASPGRNRVRLFGGSGTMDDVRVVSATPVRWIRPW